MKTVNRDKVILHATIMDWLFGMMAVVPIKVVNVVMVNLGVIVVVCVMVVLLLIVLEYVVVLLL